MWQVIKIRCRKVMLKENVNTFSFFPPNKGDKRLTIKRHVYQSSYRVMLSERISLHLNLPKHKKNTSSDKVQHTIINPLSRSRLHQYICANHIFNPILRPIVFASQNLIKKCWPQVIQKHIFNNKATITRNIKQGIYYFETWSYPETFFHLEIPKTSVEILESIRE